MANVLVHLMWFKSLHIFVANRHANLTGKIKKKQFSNPNELQPIVFSICLSWSSPWGGPSPPHYENK